MKNEIQVYIAQYVSKYFNLSKDIERDVCNMYNMETDDKKLN